MTYLAKYSNLQMTQKYSERFNKDKQSLQDDLDKLVKWSEKWQMAILGSANVYT